jgi:hypothetical protein
MRAACFIFPSMKGRLFRAVLATMIALTACYCSMRKGDAQQPTDPAGEERAIRALLQSQEAAWNEGNIEGFMEGYWRSDSLRFVGTTITEGWQATLERYRKSYPDRAAMGELRFEYYRFHFIDASVCLVTGRYHLKREADAPTGIFSLLLRKINERWVIVYDHTS